MFLSLIYVSNSDYVSVLFSLSLTLLYLSTPSMVSFCKTTFMLLQLLSSVFPVFAVIKVDWYYIIFHLTFFCFYRNFLVSQHFVCEKRPFLFNVRYRQAYVSSRSSGFSFGSGRRHYFGNSSVDQEVASQSMSECGAIRRLEIGYCHSCVIFTIALFFLNLLLPDFQAFGGQWFANVIGQQHVPPDQLVWSFYQCRLV